MSCFSCQRLMNKPEGCVEGRLTKPCPPGGHPTCAIRLCLQKAKFLPCLSARRAWKIPPAWDAEGTIFFLSLLQLSTCSHSQVTRCLSISSPSRCRWLSQTISSLLLGHTCRKKELGSVLALPGARSMCHHGCEVPLS